MPDRYAILRALHCRGKDLMIDAPACDQCEYQFQMPNGGGCDFRRLCRDAAELIGNLDKQIRELESAHAGAEELIRQLRIMLDIANGTCNGIRIKVERR